MDWYFCSQEAFKWNSGTQGLTRWAEIHDAIPFGLQTVRSSWDVNRYNCTPRSLQPEGWNWSGLVAAGWQHAPQPTEGLKRRQGEAGSTVLPWNIRSLRSQYLWGYSPYSSRMYSAIAFPCILCCTSILPRVTLSAERIVVFWWESELDKEYSINFLLHFYHLASKTNRSKKKKKPNHQSLKPDASTGDHREWKRMLKEMAMIWTRTVSKENTAL